MQTLGMRGIVIFGGARGIGAAVARRFADANHRIVVGDILSEEGRALAASSGKAITFQPCDVGVPADIDAVFDRALREAGRIDVVFNNVGITRYGTVDVLSLD